MVSGAVAFTNRPMFPQEYGARPLHNYTVILGHAVNAVLTLAALLADTTAVVTYKREAATRQRR